MRATVDRDLAREVREQRRLRNQDPRKLWSYSFEKAVAYANKMCAQSAGYREKLREDQIGLPITADSWNALPLLTKEIFRRRSDLCYGELVRKERMIWMVTSGTTGEPFRYPISRESRTAEIAANELNLLAVGWNSSMRQAVVKQESRPRRGVRGMYHLIAGNRLIAISAVDFLAESAPDVVQHLQRAQVAYLRGYARTLYLFAERILRQGISCPIPLITTLGEGLSPQEALVIERAFDGKVYRDYGGSEAMHIGFECRRQRGYHIDLARYFVEILRDGRPAQSDESGDIVVTAFRNAAMPLVRYRIGDIGRWGSKDPCPCGNRFPLLEEVIGRTADEIVTSSGHIVNVHTVISVFKHAHEHVAEFKMIQRERDHFDVLWVALHDGAINHVPALQEKLLEKCGGRVTLDWHQVADIPAEKSGKRRMLVPMQRGDAPFP